MTVTTQTISSVGSAGNWVSSSGDLAAALQSFDGEYAVSPGSSSNMHMAFPSFASAVGSDVVNSVTIRVRARTASVGQTGQITVGYFRAGISPIWYTDILGSYTVVSSDGAWAWYDFVYTAIPDLGSPFQAADLPGDGWSRLYLRYYAGAGDSIVHVDRVEAVVDHGSSGPGPVSREGVINDANSLYVGSVPVERVYLGDGLVWGVDP